MSPTALSPLYLTFALVLLHSPLPPLSSPLSLILSVFVSVAAGVEEVCCICDAPPLKEPLINCLKCRHGKETRLIISCQAVVRHRGFCTDLEDLTRLCQITELLCTGGKSQPGKPHDTIY